MICVCPSCDHKDEYDNLPEARDIEQRHEIGVPYSDVECPECGALCYPEESEPKATQARFEVLIAEGVREFPDEWIRANEVAVNAALALGFVHTETGIKCLLASTVLNLLRANKRQTLGTPVPAERQLTITLEDVLDMVACAADYGYGNVFLSFCRDCTGWVSDEEIKTHAEGMLKEFDSQYTQEDVEESIRRLTEWRNGYCMELKPK